MQPSDLGRAEDVDEDEPDWDEAQDVVGSLPPLVAAGQSPYGPAHPSSFTETSLVIPANEHEAIEGFLTIGEDVSVANQFRIEGQELPASSSTLSRISSRLSVASAATFLPPQGGYGGSLNHFTQLISQHTALYYATITSTECYTESIGLGISHRFLLMELARPGKKRIWVRSSGKRFRVRKFPLLSRASRALRALRAIRAFKFVGDLNMNHVDFNSVT